MVDVIEEKEKLINILSEQYSKSVINLSDYESIVDRVNKVDSLKALRIVQKDVAETCELKLDYNENNYNDNNQKNVTEYASIFSWRNITAKSINGNAGKFKSVFGGTQVKIDSLPSGITVINTEAVFGTIEIFVPKNVRVVNEVTPVFGSVIASNTVEQDNNFSELHITGKAVFGSIIVVRT